MELFAQIRWDAGVEGASIRALAARFGVVRTALSQAELPPPGRTPVRVSPRLEEFKAAVGAMLSEDEDAAVKQRHTARRVLARLVDEHGC